MAEADDKDDLSETGLADLARIAKDRLKPEPDRFGPAATRAMAAIVRDLKGLPDLLVSRETSSRLRLGRKGKVGSVVVEYQPKILAIEVSLEGFSDVDIGARSRRYTLQAEKWQRLDGGGELFPDLREHLVRIYPELA